jgi:uncharacterized repeat protein (TIGR01451 family)
VSNVESAVPSSGALSPDNTFGAVAGKDVQYLVTVSNGGPSAAANVVVTDTVSSFLSSVQVCDSDGNNCVSKTPDSNGVISFGSAIPSLASGGSQVWTVKGHVSPSAANGSSLINHADVSSDTTDPGPTANTAPANVTIQAKADLSVQDAATPTAGADWPSGSAVAGGTIQYQISVHNGGPSDNAGFTIQDKLPHGETFVSSNPTGCGHTAGDSQHGDTVSCSVAGLAALGDTSVTITAQIAASEPDNATYQDDASTVSNQTTDPDPTNNAKKASVNLVTRADLAFDGVLAAGSPVFANGNTNQNTVTYTITLHDNGPSDGHDVTINLDPTLAAHLQNSVGCVKTTTPQVDCSTSGQFHSFVPTAGFDIGEIPPGTASTPITAVIQAQAISTDRGGSFKPVTQAFSLSMPGPTLDLHSANNNGTAPSIEIDTVPDAPVAVLATAGNASVGLEWKPVPNVDGHNGGKTITSYHVYASPCPISNSNLDPCQVLATPDANTNATDSGTPVFSYVIPAPNLSPSGVNFKNGTSYNLTVRAFNAVGESSDSNTESSNPTAAATTSKIPSNGGVNLNTGLSGGAQTCDPQNDPNGTCKVVVSQYSLTDTTNIGSLVNLDTEVLPGGATVAALGASATATAAWNTAPTLCQKIDLSPSSPTFGTQVQGDCEDNLAVRSTYPNLSAKIIHLEQDQYDSSVTTFYNGAPCKELFNGSGGGIKFSTPPAGSGAPLLPICSGPTAPINTTKYSSTANPAIPGTNLCDYTGAFKAPGFNTAGGFGWTAAHPCDYIYFESVQVPGWNLTGAKPVACTSGANCGTPVVIGSSVANGIKVNKPYPSGPAVQVVRPWCNGSFPNYNTLPCVNIYTWQTKVATNSPSYLDMLVQTWMPEIDMIKTGGSG